MATQEIEAPREKEEGELPSQHLAWLGGTTSDLTAIPALNVE